MAPLSDEVVMVELGMAIALGKPTFLFTDEFRKCFDSNEYTLKLMILFVIMIEIWSDYCYRFLKKIESRKKAILKWVRINC
tara:strand:- start:251 stop:493 length:243 start_codon:yes stop_codon:yes gene_type:complete